jgi:hypothetical protein
VGECLPPSPPPPPPTTGSACTFAEFKSMLSGTSFYGRVPVITVICDMLDVNASEGPLVVAPRDLEIVGACGPTGQDACVISGDIDPPDVVPWGQQFGPVFFQFSAEPNMSYTVNVHRLKFMKGRGMSVGSPSWSPGLTSVYFWDCVFEDNASTGGSVVNISAKGNVWFVNCLIKNNRGVVRSGG